MLSDIAREGMKSVVSITTKSVQDVQNYLGYYGFGGSQGYTTQAGKLKEAVPVSLSERMMTIF